MQRLVWRVEDASVFTAKFAAKAIVKGIRPALVCEYLTPTVRLWQLVGGIGVIAAVITPRCPLVAELMQCLRHDFNCLLTHALSIGVLLGSHLMQLTG